MFQKDAYQKTETRKAPGDDFVEDQGMLLLFLIQQDDIIVSRKVAWALHGM